MWGKLVSRRCVTLSHCSCEQWWPESFIYAKFQQGVVQTQGASTIILLNRHNISANLTNHQKFPGVSQITAVPVLPYMYVTKLTSLFLVVKKSTWHNCLTFTDKKWLLKTVQGNTMMYCTNVGVKCSVRHEITHKKVQRNLGGTVMASLCLQQFGNISVWHCTT